MLSKLRLQTLKQKLWAIVAASFMARVIMFFALPNTASSLAPDEGTYAKLAKWIAESKPTSNFPEFGGGLFSSSRAVILPASSFVRLGVNELDAVRLSSSLYGFAGLVLVVIFAITRFEKEGKIPNPKSFDERLVLILVLVFAFLPSHFLWSTLGLREAGNAFWLMLSILFVFLSLNNFKASRWIYFSALSLSLILVYSSRPQVGWLLSATLIIFSLTTYKNRGHLVLVIFVIIGSVGGYFSTNPLISERETTYVAEKLTPNTPEGSNKDEMSNEERAAVAEKLTPNTPEGSNNDEMSNEERAAAKKCVADHQVVSVDGEKFLCLSSEKEITAAPQEQIRAIVPKALQQVEVIPEKHLANKVSAASEINFPSCPIEEVNLISKVFCLTWRVPSAISTFLFRPIPFLDTTSTLSNFASLENILWIVGVGLLVFQSALKRKVRLMKHLLPAGIFLVLYVIFAGLYEGNMGTAFRHKSLILWIVLLLLFAVFWRGKDDAMEPQRNDSQERAV